MDGRTIYWDYMWVCVCGCGRIRKDRIHVYFAWYFVFSPHPHLKKAAWHLWTLCLECVQPPHPFQFSKIHLECKWIGGGGMFLSTCNWSCRSNRRVPKSRSGGLLFQMHWWLIPYTFTMPQGGGKNSGRNDREGWPLVTQSLALQHGCMMGQLTQHCGAGGGEKYLPNPPDAALWVDRATWSSSTQTSVEIRIVFFGGWGWTCIINTE